MTYYNYVTSSVTLKYKYIDIKFLGKFINFSKREYSRILSIQKINIVHLP